MTLAISISPTKENRFNLEPITTNTSHALNVIYGRSLATTVAGLALRRNAKISLAVMGKRFCGESLVIGENNNKVKGE
jgi:hypothetical protein